jgi:hypothetical protein
MKTIIVKQPFQLNVGTGEHVQFSVGRHNVDDKIAEHWFVQAHSEVLDLVALKKEADKAAAEHAAAEKAAKEAADKVAAAQAEADKKAADEAAAAKAAGEKK